MDKYFKNEVEYSFKNKTYKFDTAHTLFSTVEIDMGTNILLKNIKPTNKPKTILDIGCGYGPIGIMMADTYPEATIDMIDKDLLAIMYTKINAKKNKVQNVEVMGSIAMEQVDHKTYDLIISNIPAKVGEKAIEEDFILAPYNHLNEHGEYWFVIISGLNRLIPKMAERNKLKITEVRKRRGHTVYKILK